MDNDTKTKTAGRPRQHESAAARQKAYRERQKAAGMREIKVMVRDVRDAAKPLQSDIIDLSQARR
jgi:hypothetical protein